MFQNIDGYDTKKKKKRDALKELSQRITVKPNWKKTDKTESTIEYNFLPQFYKWWLEEKDINKTQIIKRLSNQKS